MMKRTSIISVCLLALVSTISGQTTSSIETTTKEKTMNRLVGQWAKHYEETTYWTHDNQGLAKHRILVEPYLGHPSDSLKAISDSIDAYLKADPSHIMNKESYYRFKVMLGEYLIHHPKESMETNCLLGDLHRYATTSQGRNYERASEYYYMAFLDVPLTNKRLRGALNLRMGLSRALDISISNDFTYTIHQLFYATKEDPIYATMLGECYMLGLGVYQDLGLAMALLDLGAMSGDNNCYTYLNMIRYMMEHPARTPQEKLAEEEFFTYMIKARISSDYSDALNALFSAVDDGNVMAYYQLARLYHDMLSDQYSEIDQDYMKAEIFKYYRKAADAEFMPAIFDLALFCMDNTYDTLQGNIYSKDKKGNYREKDRKAVRQQALQMIERIADMHYGGAYDFLGDLYGDGGEFGIPERNYEKASRYHLMAARRGINSSLSKMNGFVRDGHITSSRMETLVREMEEEVMLHDMSRASIGRLAFDVSHNIPFKRTPYSFFHETMLMPEAIKEADPLLTDILEKCYHMTYDKYVVMLSNEIIQKEDVHHISSEGHIMYLRVRMKDLRESYNRKGIGMPIAKSVYEDME